MSYLRIFAPWIVYALVPEAHWQWGALGALVVSAVLIGDQLRAGRAVDAQILEIGSAVFFAVIAAVAFAAPDSSVHPYAPALAAGALTLIAGASMLLRKPFTLSIAKQTTPREFWDQPMFLRANWIITGVWTASFALTCATLLAVAHAGVAARVAVQVVGLVIPMVFTIRYVAVIQARAAELGAGRAA